jgi:hypothetical protein
MTIWYKPRRGPSQLTYEWRQGCASAPVLEEAQQRRISSRWYQKSPLWWCMEVALHSWHMSIQNLRHIIKENILFRHTCYYCDTREIQCASWHDRLVSTRRLISVSDRHQLCPYFKVFGFSSLPPPPLWSSGQSSWLQNGDVLHFLWGTNWIYICYVEESRPPLYSSRVPGCKSRGPVRFPALPDLLSSSGSGTGSAQPRWYNRGATWKEKQRLRYKKPRIRS